MTPRKTTKRAVKRIPARRPVKKRVVRKKQEIRFTDYEYSQAIGAVIILVALLLTVAVAFYLIAILPKTTYLL